VRTIGAAALALAAFVTVTSFAQGDGEQWLQYTTSPQYIRIPYRVYEPVCESTKTAPDGVALPAFKGSTQLYAKWLTPMVEAGYLWMAFDRTGLHGYDALYIDSNCDGSLAGETPVKPLFVTGDGTRFEAAKIVFPGEDGPITYHLYVSVSGSANEEFVTAGAGCWYKGTIKAGGSAYEIALVDYDSNGTFDDTSDKYFEADQILVKQGDEMAVSCVGKYIQLGGALYEPQVARDGASIGIAPAAEAPMGTLRVPDAITRLAIHGLNGLLRYEPAKGAANVPAGSYRVYEWEIDRTDTAGRKFTVVANAWLAIGAPFEIVEGKETALDIGEPFRATIGVAARGPGEHLLDETLQARGGEYLIMYQKDKKEYAPAPNVRITNADGTYNRVFATQYG